MMSMFTKRTIAYIMDFFIVSAFMWIISFVMSFISDTYTINALYNYFIYIIPILIMAYFVYCEVNNGASLGKAIMYLKVVSTNGNTVNYQQAFIRNISKIFWIPIIFDWAIGKITKCDDRILNKLTNTIVIEDHY